MISEEQLKLFSSKCSVIFEQIGRDVIGQSEVVEGTIIAMIAGGNVLLEGVPGVGKTRLVRSLGRVFNLPFSRIQFTPDLMPADVTGTNIIVKDKDGNSKFEFQPGPVFSNIVLADEINRATPKTQSALLEAMQEHTVTVMGESRKLEEPFFVLATQNPVEQDGTYPLPEAQMDRFMFKLIVEFPSMSELRDIVTITQATMAETADAVCDANELLAMRATAKEVLVADEVLNYAIRLVASTHPDGERPASMAKKYVRYGASPRAAQALISAAKVRALIHGRYNISYSDVNELAVLILRHRIKANFEAVTEHVTTDKIIAGIIKELNNDGSALPDKKDGILKEVAVSAAEAAEVAPENAETEATDNKDEKKETKETKKRKLFGKKSAEEDFEKSIGIYKD